MQNPPDPIAPQRATCYLMLAATLEVDRNETEAYRAIAAAASEMGIDLLDDPYSTWGATRATIESILSIAPSDAEP